jgi:hypothetical protein
MSETDTQPVFRPDSFPVTRRDRIASVSFDATSAVLTVNQQFPAFFGYEQVWYTPRQRLGSEVRKHRFGQDFIGSKVQSLFTPVYRAVLQGVVDTYLSDPEAPDALKQVSKCRILEAQTKVVS